MARFSFADFGLVSQGVDASADERTKREDDEKRRKQAEEDRTFQLQQRERALDEQRRSDALQTELREGLSKFLAGGAQAVPSKPAQPAMELDARQQEGGDVSTPAKPEQPAKDNLRGLYQWTESIYAKHGKLDQLEGVKGKLKKLDEEGILEAFKLHQMGAPPDQVKEAINATGKFKLANLRKITDEEYAAITEDGQPVSINMTRLMESVLSPEKYIAHKDKSEVTQAKLTGQRETHAARNQAEQAKLDAGLQVREAREDAYKARAERDRALARRTDTGPPPKPKNWSSFDNQAKGIATSMFTVKDALGKDSKDHKTIALVSSMAQALARQDPEAYETPGTAVNAAAEMIERMREEAKPIAENEAAGIEKRSDAWFGDKVRKATGKSREQFIKDRTDTLVEKEVRGSLGAARAPAGRVVQISSDEEFAALPSGAIFVGPDGKQRRKP